MPKGKWTPPESGNAPAEVKHILETVYSAYRDEHPEENEETKAHGAAVAWQAVKNAGWRKNRQGEWTKTRKAKFIEDVNAVIYEFVSKRKDVSEADKERAKKEYGNVNYADEKNKKYPLDTEKHVRAAASYFGMPKNRSKYSATDQKKIDAKIAAAKKKFGIGKENKEMSDRLTTKEFAMIPVKDTPIFRAGTYIHEKDGKKIETTFTEDNLDEMVNNYNAETPAVAILGHSSDYKIESAIPKVGIIGGLKRVGKELIATGVQFTDKLVDAIKEKYYDDRSIETYQDESGWHFYRLGILGAAPPKVKGLIPLLDSIQMSDPPKNLISLEFADAQAFEEIEQIAVEDTLKNIEQEFATCLADITNHLDSEDEPDEVKQNCLSAMMECYSNVVEEICEHFTFEGKLNQLEPEEKEEMMEKISAKLKQLFHRGTKNTHTNSKESDMDAKELKEFQEKQKALELEQSKLTEATAALEKQKLEFAEKEKVLKAKEKQEADAAIEKKLTEFREQLIAKKYPVKKMEEANIFILAKNLLAAQPLEFADGKKQDPFEILKSLIANFAPVNTGILEMKENEVKTVADLAKKFSVTGPVSKETMDRLEFVDKYVAKNSAKIPGESEKEKIAFVMTQVMTKQLDYTKGV